MCVSRSPSNVDLQFDLLNDCYGGMETMKRVNTTFTWILYARKVWFLETEEDKLFSMKCVYDITGEIWFKRKPRTKVVKQISSSEAPDEGARSVKTMGERSNERSDEQSDLMNNVMNDLRKKLKASKFNW